MDKRRNCGITTFQNSRDWFWLGIRIWTRNELNLGKVLVSEYMQDVLSLQKELPGKGWVVLHSKFLRHGARELAPPF